MQRTLLLLGLGLCIACAAVAQSTPAPTPADGTTNGEPQCLIDTLSFTNGFSLSTTFQTNVFHYTCAPGGPTSFVIQPATLDMGSSVEITVNGYQLNFRTNNPPNAISNDGTAEGSPLIQASSTINLQQGDNTIDVGVGCNGFGMPDRCYYHYQITCNIPSNGGFVVGDPQFVGLRGQSFQVHGVSGEIYNIVSDADIQYNSRFVFLDSGDCPVIDGKKQKGCFSHPGSYLGELGIKTRAGDEIHFVTGKAMDGFTAVTLNGRAIHPGITKSLAGGLGSITRNSTHLASLIVGNWDFAFENSDMFVNQRVRVLLDDMSQLQSHGLLGQTWQDKTYPNAIKFIEGQVDDYVIRDGEIFGTTFVYNKFGTDNTVVAKAPEDTVVSTPTQEIDTEVVSASTEEAEPAQVVIARPQLVAEKVAVKKAPAKLPTKSKQSGSKLKLNPRKLRNIGKIVLKKLQ